ncbi:MULTISPECIES: hypothetical protein [Burkholderia]|uniref:hypothetical protein n=1 Tax=Burkholderia TaxID=32008 RepID=UPI0011602067|nr:MULTISPECIES: hypothetical protein [Burkholderia]
MHRTTGFISLGLAIFILNSSPTWASSALSKREAEQVVARFCSTISTSKADPKESVAPGNRPEVYRKVVTSALANLIDLAWARSAAVQAATGGKPAMGDGVDWKGAPDSVSDCLFRSISGTRNRPEIKIDYILVGETTSSLISKLILKKESGEWKIDDIRYGNGKSRLRSKLAYAISEPIPASQ